MNKKKVFITGASGCIGHYVVDRFLTQDTYEIHLLVRDPKRLRFDIRHPSVVIHQGDISRIEEHRDVISTMTYIIHIATDWSDSDYAHHLNVVKTHQLFSCCNKSLCQKILYFSTASILGKNNLPISEAGEIGTGYIRSKYWAYMTLKDSAMADRIITLFPTLVIGGDATHPYSHISQGLIPNLHYAKWIRFFYMDARFHFLHAYDIASVTHYLLEHDSKEKNFVLGARVLYGKTAIQEICRAFGIPVYFQLPITEKMVFFLAKLFRIKLMPWDRFCLTNPHFEYKTVNPSSFGLSTAYPDFNSVLEDIKRQHGILK